MILMLKNIIKNLRLIIAPNFFFIIFNKYKFIAKILSYIHWKTMLSSGDIVIQGGCDMGWKQTQRSGSNVFKISRIVGRNGKVYVIEPDISNYEALIKYVKEKKLKNIVPINKALWSNKTKLKFYIGKCSNDSQLACYLSEKNISIDKYWSTEYEIDTITLDDIKEKYKMNRIDFICLTINGAEYEALQGAKEILNNFSPVYYIAADHKKVRPTINSNSYSDVLTKLLMKYNYKVYKDRKGWLIAEKFGLEMESYDDAPNL